jgi:hypothetical protein
VPEVPRVTVVGESVQARPVDGVTVAASVTVPVKPSRALTVIDDVPAAPELIVTVVGLAVTAKSFSV